jgi:hypothetical protein
MHNEVGLPVMLLLYGQIDYAMILTFVLVGWVMLRYQLLGGSLEEWVIMIIVFALPVLILYWLLKAMFVALGLMSRI